MTRAELREWFQIFAIPVQAVAVVAIPIVVAIMGNKVAESNATRETNAQYVQAALSVLASPTDANRPLQPWARRLLAHSSPVPFADTGDESALARLLLLAFQTPRTGVRSVFVQPRAATVLAGDSLMFSASVVSYGGAIPPAIRWTVSGGGKITAAGVFKADTVPGTFRVTALCAGVSDTASVTIVRSSPIARLDLAPKAVTLVGGGSAQFVVGALTGAGEHVAPGPVSWTVSGGGKISGTGLFTADTEPGTFRVTARLVPTGLSDTARVTIVRRR